VPDALVGKFDFIVVDPPFITRDVWSKYAETIRLLSVKEGTSCTAALV
jgi:EEF1A lysine methyltransferase 1